MRIKPEKRKEQSRTRLLCVFIEHTIIYIRNEKNEK